MCCQKCELISTYKTSFIGLCRYPSLLTFSSFTNSSAKSLFWLLTRIRLRSEKAWLLLVFFSSKTHWHLSIFLTRLLIHRDLFLLASPFRARPVKRSIIASGGSTPRVEGARQQKISRKRAGREPIESWLIWLGCQWLCLRCNHHHYYRSQLSSPFA